MDIIGFFINRIIGTLGYKVVKITPIVGSKKTSYIDCKDTVTDAKRQNLSVCEYVERRWNQVGATQKVIENISSISGLITVENVLEIGPGTGRYLEKIKKRFGTSKYVIYETDEEWSAWLAKNYGVFAQPADGISLSHELNEDYNLIHAHGVFTYLQFLHSLSYMAEMIRVCKKGGSIVFDFFDSEKFGQKEVEKWLAVGERYPVLIPGGLVKKIFADKGLKFDGEFDNPYGQSYSTYFVFRK